MFAFPMMLAGACDAAGIKVPPDCEDYKKEEFPHFFCFCRLQLGKPMFAGEHWENAKVVAGFTVEELMTATPGDFVNRGFHL